MGGGERGGGDLWMEGLDTTPLNTTGATKGSVSMVTKRLGR